MVFDQFSVNPMSQQNRKHAMLAQRPGAPVGEENLDLESVQESTVVLALSDQEALDALCFPSTISG